MFPVWFFAIFATTDPLDYGEVQLETTVKQVPFIHTSVGYALDISDSFSDLHSVVVQSQIRVWRFLSAGLAYQKVFPHLSQPGSRLNALEPSLSVEIPQPRWALLPNIQIQLLNGAWNLFNLFPLKADFMIGGGYGLIQSRSDITAKSKYSGTYFWSLEQRFGFSKHFGLVAQIFGHTGGAFLGGGLSLEF